MRPVLILFAKAPVPGKVKTRLAKTIGIELAAKLHKAFVDDTLEKASSHALETAIDVELHTDAETDAWSSIRVTQRLQVSGDIGRRMHHALQSALEEGRPQATIIGSDSPTLPISHLLNLLEFPEDIALGPTEDGGFYAISCRRTNAAMFRSVNWSTGRALADTEFACREAGLSTSRGATWFDVDEYEDLLRLFRQPGLPRATEALRHQLSIAGPK